jgi:peptide/bleomycin uptake transporter
MLREFFGAGWFAWFGLSVLVGHSLFAADLKRRLNAWYGTFYDLLQTGAELGSGPSPDAQEHVRDQLVAFVCIVAPLIVVHPAARYIRSVWILEWRLCLVKAYLSRWDPDARSLEGSSQRIQEDTARLARGFNTAVATVLDAALSLVVFIPVLLDLGAQTQPPEQLGFLKSGWLLAVACTTATLHMGGAWMIGMPLVLLEVNNQRVEAAFRRRLVLDESTPAGAQAEDLGVPAWSLTDAIKENYLALYRAFFFLNAYLGAFDQCIVIVPYVVVAPLLFAAPGVRVTLGVLMQVSNAFSRVFGALTVVAESWADIQDFRSTLHRLREFEQAFSQKSAAASLIQASIELRSDAEHAEVAQEEGGREGSKSA